MSDTKQWDKLVEMMEEDKARIIKTFSDAGYDKNKIELISSIFDNGYLKALNNINSQGLLK